MLQVVIYPAHAGINLSTVVEASALSNLPRTRGDKPDWDPRVKRYLPSTPHTRG